MLFHKKIKKKTKYKHTKNVVFSIILVLILLFLNIFPLMTYSSSQVIPIIPTQTTKKKPIGHKIAGAEFHEYYWEKHRVITAEGEGDSGSGGGSNKSAKESREAERKAREEMIDSLLETAPDPMAVIESVLESESIEESLKKASVQQSIKEKVFGGGNSSNKFGVGGDIGSVGANNIAPEENQNGSNTSISKKQTSNNNTYASSNQKPPETTKKQQNNAMGVYTPPETEVTQKETESSIRKKFVEPNITPSKAEVETEKQTSPTSEYRETESNTTRETTKKQQNYGGGVYKAPETEKNNEEVETVQTYEEKEEIEIVPISSDDMYKSFDNSVSPTENQIDTFYDNDNENPTSNEFETDKESKEEIELTFPETTEKQRNNAGGIYIAPETQLTEEETNNVSEEVVSETTKKQQESNNKKEEETEKEDIKYEAVNNDNNDINGEDLKQEDEFIVDEEIPENDNLFDGEDVIRDIEGKHKGVKIFELDRNGNPGIFDTGGSKTYMIDLLSIMLTILFIFGFIFQYFYQSDYKEFNSYF